MEEPPCRHIKRGLRKRAWAGIRANGNRVVTWLQPEDRDGDALSSDGVPYVARRIELKKILVPGLMVMKLIEQPWISQHEAKELCEEPLFGVRSRCIHAHEV